MTPPAASTRTAPCRCGCGEPVEQELVPVCDGRRSVWVPTLSPRCQAANARERAAWEAKAHPLCPDCGFRIWLPSEGVQVPGPDGQELTVHYECAGKRLRALGNREVA